MLKQFVSLNSNESPLKNPYVVRTYVPEPSETPDREWVQDRCATEAPCYNTKITSSPVAKLLTLEQQIRIIQKRTEETVPSRPLKKKCKIEDSFYSCVKFKRTPVELKNHAIMREKYLEVKNNMSEVGHDMGDVYKDHKNIVELPSPAIKKETESDVSPEVASPSCSNLDLIFIPGSPLLELQRPKSGIFINETQPAPTPSPADNIPYSNYNPRLLQEQFDAQSLGKIDLIEGPQPNELWTWNLGLQKKEADLERAFIDAAVPSFDCDNAELTAYKIPTNLHKTFAADVVFAIKAVKPTQLHNKKRPYYYRPTEMACLYTAYVESCCNNADFWTASTMDHIIIRAENLVGKSAHLNYKSPDTAYDIIPDIVERSASIGLRLHFTGPLKAEPNIYKALSLFFNKFNACLLCSENLFLLIWKRCKNDFYIYDPNGRSEDCERDFEKGKSALISTQFVEHLVYLIATISQVNMSEDFNLYEIYLKSYGKITNPVPDMPVAKNTKRLWAVVNDSYAIIPGCRNGLYQPTSEAVHNPSMLIAVIAQMYAYIEKSNSWRIETIDDLIRLGTAYYKSLRRRLKLRDAEHVNIADLPEKYVLGYYKASVQKSPYFYTGMLSEHCRNHQDALLASGMKELFASQWEAGILQIGSTNLAIWKDAELYYVFDPFRRGKAGQILDPEDYKTPGAACLQMHANLDSFLRILYHKTMQIRKRVMFFIHGIKVGCIKPIMDGQERKLRYSQLKLTPETFRASYITPAPREEEDAEAQIEPQEESQQVKPAKVEKPKKKKDTIDRVCSIESIPEADRIPSYTEAEIADEVIKQIICNIISALPEPLLARPKLYKHATRILLKSDMQQLEKLKYMVKHDQDYDNIKQNFLMNPVEDERMPSVEEELAKSSNFKILSDGCGIIFGKQTLPALAEEQTKLRGLLSGLVTVALSAMYKISTWSNSLIDFAIQAADSFDKDFFVYQYALGALLSNRMPKIAIGQTTYAVKVEKVQLADLDRPLSQVLCSTLKQFKCALVICAGYSCLLLKQHNFVYAFMGFPVNAVGYRKFTSGSACMLRCLQLDDLIRRIEFGCDTQGCTLDNYVVLALKALDITKETKSRYRKMSDAMQEKICQAIREQQTKQKFSKLSKMQFLDRELKRESERISEFLQEKERRSEKDGISIVSSHAVSSRRSKSKISLRDLEAASAKGSKAASAKGSEASIKADSQDSTKEDSQASDKAGSKTSIKAGSQSTSKADTQASAKTSQSSAKTSQSSRKPSAEDDCEAPFKHQFGNKLTEYEDKSQQVFPIPYGYRLRQKDGLFKIQGTKSMDGRQICKLDEVKPCFFASCFAILHVALKPLNEWTRQRIDQVIDSTEILCNDIEDFSTSFERFIKNINVDEFTFDIWLRNFEPLGLVGPLEHQLDRLFHLRKYLIMHTANCSYALMHDEYYHLFDAYGSMELMTEEDEAASKNLKLPKAIAIFKECNSASWILFADIKSMIAYIDKRACSPKWKENGEYSFHVLNIEKYKKSPHKAYILQLLASTNPCRMQGGSSADDACAHNESTIWLDHCLPVWSRLNRRNSSGNYRGLTVSKLKNYDIEIDNCLWSLWGNLHPQAAVFDSNTRGKQYLACCIMALCASTLYRIKDWSSNLLDSIIINADHYLLQSIKDIKCSDYEIFFEHHNKQCHLDNVQFNIHTEPVAFGKLYCQPTYNRLNLAEALGYFFRFFNFGILQCASKCLAIARLPIPSDGYIMFDCQSRDHPLFPCGQGAAYVLRTKYLQILLYCIVVTLSIPYYNVPFTLHKVDILPQGANVQNMASETETEPAQVAAAVSHHEEEEEEQQSAN